MNMKTGILIESNHILQGLTNKKNLLRNSKQVLIFFDELL